MRQTAARRLPVSATSYDIGIMTKWAIECLFSSLHTHFLTVYGVQLPAEGGLRKAGTRSWSQGRPGQHVRHWASKHRLLHPIWPPFPVLPRHLFLTVYSAYLEIL